MSSLHACVIDKTKHFPCFVDCLFDLSKRQHKFNTHWTLLFGVFALGKPNCKLRCDPAWVTNSTSPRQTWLGTIVYTHKNTLDSVMSAFKVFPLCCCLKIFECCSHLPNRPGCHLFAWSQHTNVIVVISQYKRMTCGRIWWRPIKWETYNGHVCTGAQVSWREHDTQGVVSCL